MSSYGRGFSHLLLLSADPTPRDAGTKMRLVELGDFKQSVPVTEDEIGRLGSGFNRMVEEIDRLVHEVYVLGMRERGGASRTAKPDPTPFYI